VNELFHCIATSRLRLRLGVFDLDADDLWVDRVGLLGPDEVGDVVDQSAVVAVGDGLGLGSDDRLPLLGGLAVDDLLNVVLEVVEVEAHRRRIAGDLGTRSSISVMDRPLLRKAIC
jgi:hypothetical protein